MAKHTLKSVWPFYNIMHERFSIQDTSNIHRSSPWNIKFNFQINPSRLDPRQRKKNNLKNFVFTLFCGASKGFIKALEAFMKPFEAPQRGAKIKILVNFYFNTTFWNGWVGKG